MRREGGVREIREIDGEPVVNRVAVLETSLHDARSRLQSAVRQGAREDERAMCWAEVMRILDDIDKLKTFARYRNGF